MSDQAKETPLVDLLRAIPEAHRMEYAIQWGEDGRPTGHALCPIGSLAHKAAEAIEQKDKRIAGLEQAKKAAEEFSKAAFETCKDLQQRIAELQAKIDAVMLCSEDISSSIRMRVVKAKQVNSSGWLDGVLADLNKAIAAIEALQPQASGAMNLEIGNFYKWKHTPEILIYLGMKDNWHQFALVGSDVVWCEVLDKDLHMLEETTKPVSSEGM